MAYSRFLKFWRNFFQFGIFPRIAFVCFLLASNTLQAQDKPNIIIILSDDQGWNDVGFNGGKDIPTPNLDQLAKAGVSFSSGYASHPYCSPSRAGLLTGRYQQRFGHENNTPYDQEDTEAGLPLDEKLLSETLKENGYRTSAIGKWHLGDAEKFWPNNRGFDEWYGFYGGGLDYWGDTSKKTKMQGVLRNGIPVPQSELTYLTDDFTNEAVKFIDKNKKEPFFLYLAFNAPHAPIQATSDYLAKTEYIEDGDRSAYAAMVVGMDEGIGKVIAKLKNDGLFENTLIFFYSDNGGHLNGANNYPFRGHKGMLFEGGIRVPFLVSWPTKIPENQRYEHPISALDIYATVLSATGIKDHNGKPLDGVDLMPYLPNNREDKPHEALFWRYSDGAGYAVRKDDFKMVMSGYKEEFLLFDLKTDPYEHENLAKKMPEKLDELVRLYTDWNQNNIPAKWYDPHPENIIKEESKRNAIRESAAKGENKINPNK
ncbi:MAG: sulfatase [Maribacter sp.]